MTTSSQSPVSLSRWWNLVLQRETKSSYGSRWKANDPWAGAVTRGCDSALPLGVLCHTRESAFPFQGPWGNLSQRSFEVITKFWRLLPWGTANSQRPRAYGIPAYEVAAGAQEPNRACQQREIAGI